MHKRLQKICDSLDLPTPVLSGSGSKGISQPYVRRAPLVHWEDLSTTLTALTRLTYASFPYPAPDRSWMRANPKARSLYA